MISAADKLDSLTVSFVNISFVIITQLGSKVVPQSAQSDSVEGKIEWMRTTVTGTLLMAKNERINGLNVKQNWAKQVLKWCAMQDEKQSNKQNTKKEEKRGGRTEREEVKND